MDNMKICESDYRFLSVVWDSAPVNSGELVRLCQERLGWKKPTTYTVLRKLCQRGFLKNENATVSVVIPKDRVLADQGERFVERVFGGSLPMFLTSFLDGREISTEEAREIREIIERYSPEKK